MKYLLFIILTISCSKNQEQNRIANTEANGGTITAGSGDYGNDDPITIESTLELSPVFPSGRQIDTETTIYFDFNRVMTMAEISLDGSLLAFGYQATIENGGRRLKVSPTGMNWPLGAGQTINITELISSKSFHYAYTTYLSSSQTSTLPVSQSLSIEFSKHYIPYDEQVQIKIKNHSSQNYYISKSDLKLLDLNTGNDILNNINAIVNAPTCSPLGPGQTCTMFIKNGTFLNNQNLHRIEAVIDVPSNTNGTKGFTSVSSRQNKTLSNKFDNTAWFFSSQSTHQYGLDITFDKNFVPFKTSFVVTLKNNNPFIVEIDKNTFNLIDLQDGSSLLTNPGHSITQDTCSTLLLPQTSCDFVLYNDKKLSEKNKMHATAGQINMVINNLPYLVKSVHNSTTGFGDNTTIIQGK